MPQTGVAVAVLGCHLLLLHMITHVAHGPMHAVALAAMTATESDGDTKKPFPMIMFRSPSPSEAAPKSGVFSSGSESIPIYHRNL